MKSRSRSTSDLHTNIPGQISNDLRCAVMASMQEMLEAFPLTDLLWTALAIAIVVVLYRLLSRSIKRFSKRAAIEPHVENTLRLVLRIGAIAVIIIAVSLAFDLDPTWILGGSALAGAAIGFGSSQTINNIVAGFYVIISKPFIVKDYIKMGGIEGQVEEISINYTKLYTPTYNLLLIPNTQVMNSQVLNCTHEGLIRYTFKMSFPATADTSILAEKCIGPSVDEFYSKHGKELQRKPEWSFDSIDRLGTYFMIRFFVPMGEAKLLYDLQPALISLISQRWDSARHA